MLLTLKNLLISTLLLALLLVGAFFLGKQTNTSSGIKVNTNRQSVVRQIESLNRLETASYTIEKVIEAGTSGNQFQQILYGDHILLVAHGKVVAGIDMSQVTGSQILTSGTRVSVTLPAATIFSTYLDNSQTKVFDRKLGLLSKGNPDLESVARASAESAISHAACSAGILDEATSNAKKRVSELLGTLGFTEISISIPQGSCDRE